MQSKFYCTRRRTDRLSAVLHFSQPLNLPIPYRTSSCCMGSRADDVNVGVVRLPRNAANGVGPAIYHYYRHISFRCTIVCYSVVSRKWINLLRAGFFHCRLNLSLVSLL